MIDYENLFNLTYYGYCFSESLRIEPPVTYSSVCFLTKDCKIGKYMVKKDEMFIVDMHHLHHNAEQWPEHEKFIPERFDSTSKYFLTSKGEKRHHMAFAPFLGGKRICLGKTFVEIISKIIGPTIIGHFDFEYLDEENRKHKPANSLIVL